MRLTPTWVTVGINTRNRPGSAMWLVMRAPFLAIGSLAICTRISWPGLQQIRDDGQIGCLQRSGARARRGACRCGSASTLRPRSRRSAAAGRRGRCPAGVSSSSRLVFLFLVARSRRSSAGCGDRGAPPAASRPGRRCGAAREASPLRNRPGRALQACAGAGGCAVELLALDDLFLNGPTPGAYEDFTGAAAAFAASSLSSFPPSRSNRRKPLGEEGSIWCEAMRPLPAPFLSPLPALVWRSFQRLLFHLIVR